VGRRQVRSAGGIPTWQLDRKASNARAGRRCWLPSACFSASDNGRKPRCEWRGSALSAPRRGRPRSRLPRPEPKSRSRRLHWPRQYVSRRMAGQHCWAWCARGKFSIAGDCREKLVEQNCRPAGGSRTSEGMFMPRMSGNAGQASSRRGTHGRRRKGNPSNGRRMATAATQPMFSGRRGTRCAPAEVWRQPRPGRPARC